MKIPAAPSLRGGSSLLNSLNPCQNQAVVTTEGPLLILAGAGTGKTRVLTTRFAYLCETGLAYPSQILAVTFTNKAAQEMKERIQSLLPEEYQQDSLWLGTFHRIGLRILKRHAGLIQLPEQFSILDTDDQLRLVKQLLKMMGVDDKAFPPRSVLWVIERMKDRGLLPEAVTRAELQRLNLESTTFETYRTLYSEYQQALKRVNAVDFGDLILLNIHLFQKHPEVLAQYHKKFRYLLVDEYQDINVAQYLWLRLLSQGSSNVCCVGDDDQSIYGWRGAEVDHILRFERDFPGATLVRLEENYRSTAPILGAASHLIAQNTHRLGKTLRAVQGTPEDENVLIQGVSDDKEEARFIGGEIEKSLRSGHDLNGTAILVRAGFQTREFEERLILMNIPYRIVGAVRFYDRLEIRDALAYFRVVVNPNDSLAFERILNTPKRGLGASAIASMQEIARDQDLSLFQAAEIVSQSDQLRGGARAALRFFLNDLQRWRGSLGSQPLETVVQHIFDESGYAHFWKKEGTSEAATRLENLKELVKVVGEFENLPGFLEHVSLVTDKVSDASQSAVSLMTLHMAKGLEFDTVFLPGWEEGLFPSPKTLDEHGQKGLEEERRLAYVGLTRAKKRATITFARSRRFYQGWQQSMPSRFIDELPEEFVTLNGGRLQAQSGRSWSQRDQKSFGFDDIYQPDSEENAGLRSGKMVTHAHFGKGRIQKISGEHLEIAFESGIKKVIARFVKQTD